LDKGTESATFARSLTIAHAQTTLNRVHFSQIGELEALAGDFQGDNAELHAKL
jgi:hypothetical protein